MAAVCTAALVSRQADMKFKSAINGQKSLLTNGQKRLLTNGDGADAQRQMGCPDRTNSTNWLDTIMTTIRVKK